MTHRIAVMNDTINPVYYRMAWVSSHFNEADSAIRWWEHQFKIPVKRNAQGVRYYSRTNLESLSIIYDLLRVRKFTIEGAKLELEKRGLLDGKHFLKQ